MHAYEKVKVLIQEFREANRGFAALSRQLTELTHTSVESWIDHFAFSQSSPLTQDLSSLGFVRHHETADYYLMRHPQLSLPPIAIYTTARMRVPAVTIRVDSISDYLLVRGQSTAIEGAPLSGYRRSNVAVDNGTMLWVCERRGDLTLVPVKQHVGDLERYFQAREMWRTRPRDWEDETEALNQAIRRIQEMIKIVGPSMTATFVLEGERDYWQSRNRSGQWQKACHDHLGLGWGGPCCYLFSCTRERLALTFQLFASFGFRWSHCERAGLVILRHPQLQDEVWLKFDAQSHERDIEVVSGRLPPLPLGEVGLWCGLHGESLLKGGMSSLGIALDIQNGATPLFGQGIHWIHSEERTESERWPVSTRRLHRLVETGVLTARQASHWAKEGAPGSDLIGWKRA